MALLPYLDDKDASPVRPEGNASVIVRSHEGRLVGARF